MPRLVPILLLMLASAPAGATPPEELLEEAGRRTRGAVRPYVSKSGTLRGRAPVRVRIPLVRGCAAVMVAVEPADAAITLRFLSPGGGVAVGEQTAEGIWQASACGSHGFATFGRRLENARVELRGPRGTLFALWAFDVPGLIGFLSTDTAPPRDVLAEMAAQMPRTTARVRIADVTTEGTLTVQQALRVLSMPRGLLACWRDPVETDPTLAGDRALMFVVGPTGTVVAASVAPSDHPASAAPTQCSAELLRRITFPATADGTTSRVRAVLRVEAETRTPAR